MFMDPKTKKPRTVANPLELLREDLFRPMGSEAINQILRRKQKTYQGEIAQGESLEIKEVFSGKRETEENLAHKLVLERNLHEEEQVLVEKKVGELRVQIKAIHEEIIKLAEATPKLSYEVDIAAFQAPVSPTTYELYFLQRIFEFIKGFREKIHEASYWLKAANRRASRKNVWGANYKKHGAKYLLSGEHYLQRSAG